MRKWMLGITILALAIAIPSIALAHDGHAHKVMGTVTNIAGNHVTVKTTDGKTAMVMLDAKTKITQGKNKVDASALKVGDRVVAEGLEEKEMIMAATLQLGVAPTAALKK